MFESAYLFTRGLLTFEYDVPIPLQIGAYIFVGIIITIFIYIYRDALDLSVLRDQYMWYYFVAIFNILNICMVLSYYYYRKGTYIGEPGKPGRKGPAGDPGKASSCSLCEQNIYMIPSTSYDLITKMDFLSLAERVINPDLAKSLTALDGVFSNQNFDYGEFTNNIINGTFDPNNELTSKLMLLSIYNEYPLIKYVNENMGLADQEATGYFKSLTLTPGYFGLSDMAFGGSEPFNPTAFLVNGDIRTPASYKAICTFATVNDSGNIAKYNILSLEPPQDSTDKYVALGNIIQPQDSAIQPDIARYAMVREKCTKKLASSALKLVFIYPGASYELANSKNTNPATSSKVTQLSEGFFSIWRTPFSTIHVKYVDGKFQDGKSIIENLYVYQSLVPESPKAPESIYNKSGTVKRAVIEKVKGYLEKIRLPKVIFGTYLFGFVIEKVKAELKEFVDKYVTGGRQSIMLTTALKKCQAPDTVFITDISQAMKDIASSIQAGYEAKLAQAEAEMAKTSKKRIRSFLDVANPAEAESLDYQMIKDYDRIKTAILELSVKIENGKTLADLVQAVFPGGLSSKVNTSTILPTQERLLNFVSVLIPPETDIYILRNDCLAYEQIDEARQDITIQLESSFKKLSQLTKQINSYADNPKSSDKTNKVAAICGGEKTVDEINKRVAETYEFISRNLGHIPDYLKKLERGNYEEFTTDKLLTIQGQVTRLVEFMESKCS